MSTKTLPKLTPVACAVAAGLVGLATNLVRPTFFTNIELVLGGIAPLLVAAALGRWAGLVAGVICFCVTPLYWFHHVGWLAYGLEAFVVGHLMHHRRLSLLGASLRYWLCFGMPVAAVYFTGFSYAAFPANIIALVKYPLNGLLVALVAQEFSNHRRFQRLARNVGGHVHLPQLQDLLITRFTSLTALPILIISLVAYGALDRQLSQTAEYNLQSEAMELRDALETHFERTAAAWSSLLEERNRETNPAARGHLGVQHWLAQHPEWSDLHFIDSRGEQSAVPAPTESAASSATSSSSSSRRDEDRDRRDSGRSSSSSTRSSSSKTTAANILCRC